MISNFRNKPLSDDFIARIAEQCTFSGMKKNAASYSIKSHEGETSLLRKGVVGDWKNYFTPELNERFENEVLAKLKGTGLEFDFEMWNTFSKTINSRKRILSDICINRFVAELRRPERQPGGAP